MRKVFALYAALLLSLSLPSAFGQEQAPAPEYRDGDSWQFNAIEKGLVTSSTKAVNGDFRVTFRRGEVRVAPVGEEKSGTKQSTGELQRMLAINDEPKYLEFPLSLNKKWSAELEDELRRGATVRSQDDMKVVGYEEVTTAAGKFKAFKIERYKSAAAPVRDVREARPATLNMFVFIVPTRAVS